MSTTKPAFSASVPEAYERYLVPLLFEDYAEDLVRRLGGPGVGRVLETACGTGALTRPLRRGLAPEAEILATDTSEAMLAQAKARLPQAKGLEYRVADATALPCESESFDAVLCQFGVMFFPDRAAGYREAARVLRPGGRFLFNVWDSLERNELLRIAQETLTRLFPVDAPAFFEVPFGYHDRSQIRTELQQAGFGAIELAVVPKQCRAPSAHEVALAVGTGSPLHPLLVERNAQDAFLEAFETALLREHGSGAIAAPMQAIVVTAGLTRSGPA